MTTRGKESLIQALAALAAGDSDRTRLILEAMRDRKLKEIEDVVVTSKSPKVTRCARPGCEKPARKGRKYCSRDCIRMAGTTGPKPKPRKMVSLVCLNPACGRTYEVDIRRAVQVPAGKPRQYCCYECYWATIPDGSASQAIRDLAAQGGLTRSEIAAQLGVTRQRVAQVLSPSVHVRRGKTHAKRLPETKFREKGKDNEHG